MEAEALTTQDLTTHDPATHDPAGSGAEAATITDLATGTEVTVDAESRAGGTPFTRFGVADEICDALTDAGIVTAFPIQELTLPVALAGHDVIGQARTGTGKTLAFGIPMLQHVLGVPRGAPAAPRGLVMVPTRELAIQVADDLRTASARTQVNVVTLYGGRAYEPQIEALATVDIVVGTPGRLLDLSRQRQLNLSRVDILVLDEADRMLDLGFLPDVEAILRLTPDARQTMLFSATMPSEVVTLARRHLRQPMHIRAEHHDEPAHVPTTDQHVFRAHQLDKTEVLARVLQAQGRGLTIVFCRTRRACDQVTANLADRGFAAAAVHGDLGQGQRERALRAFRTGKIDVLVATDVAARGLDVDDVTHVVNYECPEDEKAYLHRIGRTGRAGRTGVAVTFVDWQDLARWKLINETLSLGHPEPLETYSTSEHLFSLLGIPAGVNGSLPRAQRDRAGLEAEELEDIGETGKHKSGQRQSGGRASGRHQGDGRVQQGHGGGSADGTGHRGRSRPSRRRTRGGVPIGAAAQPGGPPGRPEAAGDRPPQADGGPAVAGEPGPGYDQAGEQPGGRRRKRRRPARRRGTMQAPGHSDDQQPAASQGQADQAGQRDIEVNLAVGLLPVLHSVTVPGQARAR